jgi:DNA-binding GntR family transcriptional regulator
MTHSLSTSVYSSLQAPAPTLERVSLKDQATSLLREYIVKGRLPAGSKLIERELADWLGVSRMPVHDALVQLEKEGLVVTKTDARYVIDLTRQDLYELFQVRVVLERLAAELAAANNTPEYAARYDELQDMMRKAVDRRDIEAFVDGHMEIHRTIWRQACNPHLQNALNSILGPILMFMARSEYINWDESLERHGGIIDAIQNGDPALAGESMTRHIVQSLNHTMQSFHEGKSS